MTQQVAISDNLWHYYECGYNCLMQNGLLYRQMVRPALSHLNFTKVVPLLTEYARASSRDIELPPGFEGQMEALSITPRDLLHLDYAICMGYSHIHSKDSGHNTPVLVWPGPVQMLVNLRTVDRNVNDEFDPDSELISSISDGEEDPPFKM